MIHLTCQAMYVIYLELVGVNLWLMEHGVGQFDTTEVAFGSHLFPRT